MISLRGTFLITALTLSATALATPPQHGPPGKHRGPPPPHEVIRKHADELGIDDETVQAIVDIAENARDEMHALHQVVRKESRALRGLLDADEPDRRAVHRQVDVLKSAEAAVQKQQLTTLIEIRSHLTLEQRDAIKELHQRMKRQGPPHGRGGHRGPPPGHRGPK